MVDGRGVHRRALDGRAHGRREVEQWRPETADRECFCGEGPNEQVTRTRSYDEDEERAYLLIKPDPRCPECTAIMDWRSAHRWIAIPNGAEIRLSDNLSVGRHLHMRDVRVAHHKIRLARERKERESKERFHPVA